ncbi:MAG: Vi polysaccharide biosynthesis UDP-N-acetylglucosamine C-6 dehydrogenase TviB, partial [Thermoplasmata archaeon]|nr:Vi polysaccharide biosynthesis UDP-N-acetylglucosamine C-6 dehydrogenase TviB [Thermoplasmata archaeon]NIY05756.1 Vi polysaccharide biosynthesis UDP-N-acetylglucosamine C-6 dehydrogenase TviB [Thermoplasmata archaeon]
WDPWADPAEAEEEYVITPLADQPETGQYDAVILAVPHREFLAMGPDRIRELGTPGAVLFDVKSVFEP